MKTEQEIKAEIAECKKQYDICDTRFQEAVESGNKKLRVLWERCRARVSGRLSGLEFCLGEYS